MTSKNAQHRVLQGSHAERASDYVHFRPDSQFQLLHKVSSGRLDGSATLGMIIA